VRLAFQRVAPIAFLALLPALVFVIGARMWTHDGSLGLDFRHELYPEAQDVLQGRNPFPGPDVALTGVDKIYPIPAALLVSPLTILPPAAATWVWLLLSLGALAAALRLLGVTDWRVYGLVALWSPSISEFQTGNVTAFLVLLVALAWRFRDRRFAPGVAVGLAVAVKLFLWPLGVWLLARRQFAATATAAAIGVAGTLLVLPFTSLSSYLHLISRMDARYGSGSYNVVGLTSQLGLGRGGAHLAAWLVGLAVLAVAARRRSFTLALAASMVLAPIFWLHYFLLLVVPLALRWPRLSVAWAIPLLFWFCLGSGAHLRDIAIGLAISIVVFVLSSRPRFGASALSLPEPNANAV
jgi:hypothetical protein